jgi:serine/threonine protein phosphatase 1
MRLLKGNHEQMMLAFLDNPQRAGEVWLANGGDATLQSYGVRVPRWPSKDQLKFMRNELLARMPEDHLNCFRGLQITFTAGDYFFCHARTRKGSPLAEQSERDLLWSRGDPDDMDFPQEKIIVHGHIPVIEPQMGKYHINIDTGAFVTGRLTAVRLQGSKRDFQSAWLNDAPNMQR